MPSPQKKREQLKMQRQQQEQEKLKQWREDYDRLQQAEKEGKKIYEAAGGRIRATSEEELKQKTSKAAKSAVVIGGGVLGLEAAWSLQQAGLNVSVVEFDARVMARQVDAETSERIACAMRDYGVQLYTCASTAKVDDAGLHLSDGRILPVDLVSGFLC